MPVTTLTVTGLWKNPDNTVASGYVEFTPVDERFANSATLVAQQSVRALLDSTGAISIALVRCTNGYTVKEVIKGSQMVRYVLADQAGPVDLSTSTEIE